MANSDNKKTEEHDLRVKNDKTKIIFFWEKKNQTTKTQPNKKNYRGLNMKIRFIYEETQANIYQFQIICSCVKKIKFFLLYPLRLDIIFFIFRLKDLL